MNETASFGAWIAQRRKMLDMTQRELAERANCAVATIKKIERDDRRPSRELAKALAGALQIPANAEHTFVECARGIRSVDPLIHIGKDNGTDAAILSPRQMSSPALTSSITRIDRGERRAVGLQVESEEARTSSTAEGRNRYRMLQNVYTFWIKGVLDNSLHGALLLDLGMKQSVGSVGHPWEALLRIGDNATHTLPPSTAIVEVFDQMNGKLLILGDPGSGKTTLLLELARDLLGRAERDSEHPIPVVFNLSSWAEQPRLLTDWLTTELNSTYQVPKALAQQWVKEDTLLLLLDGLDEVDSNHRQACVQAINRYRSEHGFVDLVVCSRTADYEALTGKLNLNGAIALQQLNDSQIDAYLRSLGDGLTPLRRMLFADPALQEMIRSPLMLSITVIAYRDAPSDMLQEIPEERRQHVFDTYVQRMIERRLGDKPYSKEQTLHYLRWLAQRMTDHTQSLFLIEGLQPDWLTPDQFKRYSRLTYTLVVSGYAILFCAVALIGIELQHTVPTWTSPAMGTVSFAIVGTFLATLIGCYFGIVYAGDWWRRQSTSIITALLMGCSIFFLFIQFLPSGNSPMAFIALVTIYYVLVQFGRAQRGKIGSSLTHILFAEKIVWHWRKINPLFVLLSPIIGIATSAVGYILVGQTVLIAPMAVFCTLLVGTLVVMIGGIEMGGVESRIRPNQGVWQSFSLANKVVVASGAVFVLSAIVSSMTLPIGLALPMMAYNALYFLPTIWLIFGTGALYHFLMRRVLEHDGLIPKNMAHFLNFCDDHILLRKVGGSYIFIHRALLEYFAAL